MKPILSQEYLKSLLHYVPKTGVLRWKVKRSNIEVGNAAGAERGSGGYIQVQIDGRLYRAHRIIWKMMTGSEPPQFLDHINMIKNDNRWCNIRAATKSQNQANTGLRSDNISGFKGVSRYSQGEASGNPWQASIQIDGKSRGLGHFPTKEEAHAAYMAEAKKLFGDFARSA